MTSKDSSKSVTEASKSKVSLPVKSQPSPILILSLWIRNHWPGKYYVDGVDFENEHLNKINHLKMKTLNFLFII